MGRLNRKENKKKKKSTTFLFTPDFPHGGGSGKE
jgi:hypothetical protein